MDMTETTQPVQAPNHTLARKIIAENEKREWRRSSELYKKLNTKLNTIREKDNCLRVRALDRIADFLFAIAKKIEKWSESVRNYNARTTPICNIKLPPRRQLAEMGK